MSKSTILQSCWDNFLSSWVEPIFFKLGMRVDIVKESSGIAEG